MPRRSLDNMRIIVLVVMLVMLMLLEGGRASYVVTAIGICLNLSLHFLQRPTFFRLIMFWQVGFILLIGLDGLFDYEAITHVVHESVVQAASKYLTIANAAVLLGHALVFSERGFRLMPWYASANLRASPWLPWFMALLYILFLVDNLPTAYMIATQGRAVALSGIGMVIRGADEAIFSNLAALSGLILPAMMAYYFLWIRGARLGAKRSALVDSVLPATLLSSPIFLTQIFIGNRSWLILAAVGLFVVISARHALTMKTLIRLFLLAVMVLSLSIFMREARVYGGRGLIASEGVLASMAKVVDYYSYNELEYGATHGAVLVFWIPRAVWPDKPARFEYWFIRAYGETGFGVQHSIAASFAANAYADFGFVAGILLCLLGGIILGVIEGWGARVIARQGHPHIVMVAPLYGITFFATRQFSYTFTLVLGLMVLSFIFLNLLTVRKRGDYQAKSAPSFSSLTVTKE
jgi:hypothetical protein